MEKHQRENNKPQRNKDSEGWKRLTRITNHELEESSLNFSRHANRGVAPLNYLSFPSVDAVLLIRCTQAKTAAVNHNSRTLNSTVTNTDVSPGQTIATCQRNTLEHCWAQHV